MAKWLFVGEFAGFAGGIERYMFQTAAMLRRHGHQVDGLFHTDSRDAAAFQAGFDRVWRWDQSAQLPEDYQLVVIHKVRTPALIAELRCRFRVVAVLHDHEFYCPRTALYYPLTRRNCHRAYSRTVCGACAMLRRWPDGLVAECRRDFFTVPALWKEIATSSSVVVLSDFMRGQALRNGIAPERIQLIPPAIALPGAVASSSSEPPRLLVVGQWIRGKGIDQLLRAFPAIRSDFRLDLVGAGKDEMWLRELARPYGEKVQFHGWSQDPGKFYRSAAIAVLPWRWQEPFGLVGPEALAYEVPLVGFDVGGIREYLRDRETGILVPEGDIAGLAAAIDLLLADPALRRRLGSAGRRLVETTFTESALLSGWEALLRD